MRVIAKTSAAILLAAAIASAPAAAGNTVLFGAKGDVTLPISPPNNQTGAPGALDNTAIGQTTAAPGSFTTLQFGQIRSAGGTPTIASGACGSGTNGTIAAGSSDQAGTIQIGATATTACAVSFSTTLAAAPKACVLFPANAAAAATGTTVAYVSAISTSGFTVTGSALANANYRFICL